MLPDVTPAMGKTRNAFLSLAMHDKALPVAFAVIGVALVIHSIRKDKPQNA